MTDAAIGSKAVFGRSAEVAGSVPSTIAERRTSEDVVGVADLALASAMWGDLHADRMASTDGATRMAATDVGEVTDLSRRADDFAPENETDAGFLDGESPRGEPSHADGDDEPHEPGLFPIVGIGASAGGLESLERLFRSMPVDTGMAFVVIQHLSPDFKSLMDELLARYTAIPVHRAVDGMPVRPNSTYLIPPKKEMIISGQRLLLTDKDPKQALTMPIDRFFRSLAQDAGKFAIGVILSGSGSDGSRGIRDIHHAGGLILCESQQTAKFDGMPVAAMGTGDVDGVMAPEEMPNALIKHAAHLEVDPVTAEHAPEPEGMETVFRLLNDAYGIDFSHYKPNTVGRRIQRRLSLNHDLTLDAYAERLRNEPDELNVLYRDLLIGVTRFFRDVEAYEKLERDVIPELLRKTPAGDEIRVWVAGCATGEEAYSLAILLHEQIEKEGRPIKAKLFATDVHRRSLAIANEGVYSAEALADVTPERLQRYFDRRPDGYHVVSDLRQMIVFASHNVIKDAPFTKIDLISCRNLLIYFRPLTQRKAISLFHFGLKTGGVLFLGPSETPSELQDEFDTLDAHWKLFRKRRDVRLPSDLRLPLATNPLLLRATQTVVSPTPRGVPDPTLIGAYDVILDRYMPPGLLINERRELLHAFGGAEKYLHVKRGRPTNDVFDLLDSDLRTAVIGAVQRVLKDGKPVRYAGVRLTTSAGEERLDLTVEPVDNTRSRFAQILIILKPLPAEHAQEAHAPSGEDAADNRRISRDRIESLELELRYSKENLQATIEELETSNEEMQATNEELVASNEELQSTNEELQSVNEELYTVNAEYQKKIAELSELTADMDNLLESTDVGTIFLDSGLTIRKFTPQIGQAFHLLPQDIGRPIDSFAHSILHEQLVDDLRRVLATNERCEKEVRDRQGKWLYLRILPYRTKTRMDGVVLTLIDVTTLKRAEGKLAEAVRLRDEFLAMLSHELRNPLGAILNATSLMKLRSPEDEVLAEACAIVDRQSRHLARLLDDLLDVSRVTQRKIALERKPIRVAEFVRNAIDSARPLLRNNDLDFGEETEGLNDLCVDGDSGRLQQALSNVLANAAKYTPRGGRVSLRVYGEGNDVVMCVRDTGVGIAPDRLESIFDLFVQENSPLHRSAGGMGIGLTLARSIVERHDGTIRARSEGSGQGSEFEIRLPRIDPLGVPTSLAKGPIRREPLHRRILIVEDDSDNRTMLAMLLEVEECEVFTAENGPQGLSALEQHRPDVALIDIGLPGMTGYEVARRARSNPDNDNTLLIALTGYGQASDIAKARQAGFDDHLVKPLDPNRLRSILAKHEGAIRSN